MKTGSPLQGLQAGAVIHFPLQLGALFPVIYHLTTVFVCFPLGREPGGLVLGTPPPDALTTTAAVSSRRGRWPQASGTRHPSSLPAQPSPRDLLLLGEARSQQSQPSSQVLQEPCGTLWKRRKNHPECVGPTEEEFSARDLRPHCLACFPALSESHGTGQNQMPGRSTCTPRLELSEPMLRRCEMQLCQELLQSIHRYR
ncbi:uncharacterized protein LOC113486553 isoform X5 [Athene cunicularia]|uniref:uncharacterized protein LOC113486553 isoform X5 n=2 Tax=Athene cunicularia TaxID=194338 RepID=UPI000EF6811B|nr:uncharacterized protein LOC113486553 isoform X5 [Athene cunicularia]